MRKVAISLHGGGMIHLQQPRYELRLNDDGRVVLVVGKTEHVTRFTDVEQLRAAIERKRGGEG